MRPDPSKSRYHEDPAARNEFSGKELKHMRVLLRRLRFLEAQVAKRPIESGSGGAVFADLESSALAWVLTEVGFLAEPTEETAPV